MFLLIFSYVSIRLSYSFQAGIYLAFWITLYQVTLTEPFYGEAYEDGINHSTIFGIQKFNFLSSNCKI